MNEYLILAEDTPNSLELRRTARPAHLARLKELQQQNRLVLAGPYFHQDTTNPAQGGVKGSMLVLKFDSITTAKEWAAADPYVTAGVYQSISVNTFKTTVP